MSTTVTFQVPDGYRIAAYLVPTNTALVDVDQLAAVQIALADRVRTYGTDDNAGYPTPATGSGACSWAPSLCRSSRCRGGR